MSVWTGGVPPPFRHCELLAFRLSCFAFLSPTVWIAWCDTHREIPPVVGKILESLVRHGMDSFPGVSKRGAAGEVAIMGLLEFVKNVLGLLAGTDPNAD